MKEKGRREVVRWKKEKYLFLKLLSGNAALESIKSLKYFFISKEKYK
jgi:hypothetical protein